MFRARSTTQKLSDNRDIRLSYLTSPAPAPDFRVKYGNNVFLCHKVLFLHPLQDSEVFRRLISDDPTVRT